MGWKLSCARFSAFEVAFLVAACTGTDYDSPYSLKF